MSAEPSAPVVVEKKGPPSIRRRVLRSSLLLLAILVLALGVLLFFEESFIYFPEKYPAGFWQPEAFRLPAEDVWFEASDGTALHGWFAPAKDPAGTILYSHGNGGNLTYLADVAHDWVERGWSVFLYDYRGYGRSAGVPGEAGLYLDAQAAWDATIRQEEVDPERIVLIGQSLGGAVATELALRSQPRALVLESTFTRVADMASRVVPLPGIGHLVRTKFETIDKIARVGVPLLVAHGNRDTMIPFDMGRRVYEAAKEPKRFVEVERADHNDLHVVGGRTYLDQVEAFLDEALRGPSK